MKYEERTSIEDLTTTFVHIKKQKYVIEESKEPVTIGNPWRTALSNTERGREQLKEVLPEEYFNAVMTLWGDKPLVDEIALNPVMGIKPLPDTTNV